ncbi:MAG: hypothetical protein ABIE43_03335 [Patescibacteria group bacterium]
MCIFRNKKFLYYYIIILSIGFIVLSVNFCYAQALLKSSEKVEYEGNIVEGNFTLNDFTRVAIRVSELILGIVGSLALLMFIYGGIMFLVSAGNSEKVTQAKQIIVGAVVGLAIVFASYMIITFVAQSLGIEQNILQSGWFNK